MKLTSLNINNWAFDQQVLERCKVFQTMENRRRLSTPISIYLYILPCGHLNKSDFAVSNFATWVSSIRLYRPRECNKNALFFFPKIMVYIIRRVNNLVSNVKSISCLDFLKFIPLVWRVQVLTRCLLSGYAQAWVYKILKKHIPFSVD